MAGFKYQKMRGLVGEREKGGQLCLHKEGIPVLCAGGTD